MNGPTSSLINIEGLTIDPETEEIIDRWSPPGVRENFEYEYLSIEIRNILFGTSVEIKYSIA